MNHATYMISEVIGCWVVNWTNLKYPYFLLVGFGGYLIMHVGT